MPLKRYIIYRLSVLFIILGLHFHVHAYNMRQTSNSDGLSNSAILSLSLDDAGFLWIGTCDGVNIADGISVTPFSTLFPGLRLSGNIIEKIVNTGDGQNWVLTNYGLDHVDSRLGTVRTYPQFHGQEWLCYSSPDNLFVMTEDSRLHCYDRSKGDEFEVLTTLKHNYRDVKSLSIHNNTLLLVAADGIYSYDLIHGREGSYEVAENGKLIDKHIVFAKSQGETIFIIDDNGMISQVGQRGEITPVTDISDELKKRGSISDLVHDHQGNFFISFATDGAMWVGINTEGQYQAVDLGLRVGVFCLEQSPLQDVVWIGSDCQGVYTYWDDQYSIRSFDFSLFNKKITHPVRAVYLDKYKNLWLGTKGDGVLKVRNFNEYYPKPGLNDSELFTSFNSGLSQNLVFGFCPSSRPILWIATEDGVSYYNYDDGKIFTPQLPAEMKYVHGVYEENDSTLWAVTLGYGVIKASISGPAGHPVIDQVKIYTTEDTKLSANLFFAMTADKNGNLLFCNRGLGIFEIKNDKLVPVPFKNDFGIRTVYDVFDAIKDDDALWIGTGTGLIKSSEGEDMLFFGTEKGFANNTIHEMIRTDDGEIWLSTNKGLVRFDPGSNESETYGRNYGLTVTEFSDGAGFNTGNSLIFGGINGLTIVTKHDGYVKPQPFCPQISLSSISVAGRGVILSEYIDKGKSPHRLVFDSNQNHFTLSFAAPDFINAYSYMYYYTLDGKEWINNGPNPTISFNEMSHGTYNLKVKYVNRATGYESAPYSLQIVVKAPWYLSGLARFIYLLMAIGLVFLAIRQYMRRQREAMARLEQQHREEVYEEKLKFFTNITHEFCTPLTLLYGPCERILAYPGADDYIRKYVGLIRDNTERLNTLIQELIDFRRIETGHKQLRITPISISDICEETMRSFSELAERNDIDFVDEIAADIVWNSDFSSICKILNNLISNAFKYTASGGTIRVSVKVDNDTLIISVYNTGKGIREEDKAKIFNRYSVLDNVEENAIRSLSHRNGLGMAICHSMVEMLDGSITIESAVGQYADFIVRLPRLEADPSAETNSKSGSSTDVKDCNIVSASEEYEPEAPIVQSGNNDGVETILVIDDNPEILALLSDTLSDYNVVTATSADNGLEFIRHTVPAVIISDIMMPGTDGMELTRQLKGNRHTMHIPLVLLSAKNSTDEKVAGIESGADAYVGKPFSPNYLRAVVKRLLESRSHLKEYYNTSASAYEYSDGRLLHREDKEYLQRVVTFIDEHIDDSELSPEQLAAHLKTSVRNLYRKFKELDEVTPNDFIKNHRMAYAAKLLLTTSMTVQEIIYRSGFNNRSHFYKEFDKRYGMTPKDYRTNNVKKDSSLEKYDK